MSDQTQKFIRYGDKKIPMPEGMNLEKAKEIMARHFPELAEPQVETKTEDGAQVYVFTKQMGRKGAGAPKTGTASVCAKLARLNAIQLVPPEIVELMRGAQVGPDVTNVADMELPRAAENLTLYSGWNARNAIQCTQKNLLGLAPADSKADDENILL